MTLSWDERYQYARDPILPWVEQVAPLRGRRVVEFGCGNGPITCAIAERGATVLALDIDEGAVAEGKDRAAGLALRDIEFVAGGFEALLAEVQERTPVDVFFLFAVLEHMTIDERLRTLAAAREAIGADGHIVVCESPNRLLPWDHHTAQLPFFGVLPDELALRYLDRSPRGDFKDQMADALARGTEGGLEQLVRWGRGVSFHEFELAFDDFPSNVVAGGYDPVLLKVREIHREELGLARFLRRERPEIPPSFSRYWLDLIIAGTPPPSRRVFTPWPFETTNSHLVDLTEWDTLLLHGPESRLVAKLDDVTVRVLVGMTGYTSPIEFRVHAGEGDPIGFSLDAVGPSERGYRQAALPHPVDTVTITVSAPAQLSFLAYAADG